MNQGKLSIKEKVGFSLGDMASNLYFQTFMLFMMYFYTDVFGIPAAAVGTMFLFTRIWDAVNDPIMGAIADRTNTKYGKFRPYLLWLAIPYGIIGVLTFTTPALSVTGKIIYAYITYTLIMMIYTAINVPYSALMGVMTPNSLERTQLSTYRFVAAFIGGLIVQLSTMGLVKTLGHGNEQLGWQLAIGVLAVLAIVLFVITYFTTKERVKPPKAENNQFKQDLKDLFMNKAWIFMAIATFFQLCYIVIRNGATMYYFKYYVQDQSFTFLGNTYDWEFSKFVTIFMAIGSVATISGAMLAPIYSKYLGKKTVYAGFLAGSALFNAFFLFLQPQNVILILLFQVIINFILGPVAVLQWAMYTDCADFGEWKFNRRATGLIMSASLFALKLGLTFGGAIIGWVLAASGFVPNAVQNDATVTVIKMLQTIIPSAGAFIGAGVMIFYPLTNKMMEKIESDLVARREN